MLKTTIDKCTNPHNQGFSAISMVIILLLLGTILITTSNQILLSTKKNMIVEKYQYMAVNQALSSIQWATSQRWQNPSVNWLCQDLVAAKLTACIKKTHLSKGNYILIRGQYEQIKQYHLATYTNGKLTIEKGHWLDYCPENRGDDCE